MVFHMPITYYYTSVSHLKAKARPKFAFSFIKLTSVEIGLFMILKMEDKYFISNIDLCLALVINTDGIVAI